MPKIKVSVPHKLGQDKAKERITKLIGDARVKFGDKVSDVKEAWTGTVDNFSFAVMGFSIEGQLDVQQDQVLIDMDLPWTATPFKGMVESEIVKRARELLA